MVFLQQSPFLLFSPLFFVPPHTVKMEETSKRAKIKNACEAMPKDKKEFGYFIDRNIRSTEIPVGERGERVEGERGENTISF